MQNGAGVTVAPHDIARLADVGRAAVSNWRRSFPDFPAPVGGNSASPRYSLAEVEAWLTRHGKRFMPGHRVWQQVRDAVDDLRLADLVGYLGAFLVFLQRDSRRWKALARQPDDVITEELTPAVAAAVPELPGDLARLDDGWVATIRLVGEVATEQQHAKLFDFLVDRYLHEHSRQHSAVTPSHLAELMVDLADVSDGWVLDPACGTGTLLRAAHTRGATSLRGQDIDGTCARLAAARLLLHDTAVRVVAGDSLRRDAFADERADAVVCNPPSHERSWGYDELARDPRWKYGLPPRGEPELAWVQHCLARTKPRGRVVMMMPASAASRRSGRRIRANLLRSGALRAVISLPGTGPAATGAVDLWVLCRPDINETPSSHVLMVDASKDPSIAVRTWRSFLADPDRIAPGPGRSVRITDLLDDEVDLSPVRHAPSGAASAETATYQSARTKLLTALAALAETLPNLIASTGRQPIPMTTVGELVKAGVIAIHRAPVKMSTDTGDIPVLTETDVRLGRPPSGRTMTGPGSLTIEPGDVIVPITAREPLARVATDTAALLGPQLFLFRVDPEEIDPSFLAGFLRIAQSHDASRGASVLTRTNVGRASIPRLPLAEQRDYGEAFRRLAAFKDMLKEATSIGETLARQGFARLADGTLQPGGDRPR